MDFTVKTLNLVKQHSNCLVVGVFKGKSPLLSNSGNTLNEATSQLLSKLLAEGDLTGENGTVLMIYPPQEIKSKRILLLGLGKSKDISVSQIHRATKTATKILNKYHIRSADFTILDTISERDIKRYAKTIVAAVQEAAYSYTETKSIQKKKNSLTKVSLIVNRKNRDLAKAGMAQGLALSNGLSFTKTIANLPGNICTPSYLAQKARDLEKTHNLKTTVLDESDMEKLNMGSLLSVSRGSREPAKLIIMEYSGGSPQSQPVVLVGKGLTFDAGGISIKPASAMDEMKYDMCGGASVFGALIAAAEMKLTLNIVGIVPSSENLPDGAANKPGDIVTSMAGKTIEILNTDAEGRLLLCDALTYAKRHNPAVVIDIATLTGACITALGHHASGLFCENKSLASDLTISGDISGDRVWRLPMWDDYTRQLDSNFADLANIGGRDAGAITAACFLKEFTKSYTWAHLDVAGTAWKSKGPKGATGRPVQLLVEFLTRRSEHECSITPSN